MRLTWLWLVLLVGIAVVLQGTLLSLVRIHHVGPDFVFIIAFFYMLFAPTDEAKLAAVVAGFALDLLGSDVRLGTFALSYGIAGLFVVYIREFVFREHPVVQLLVALVACLIAQVAARGMVAFYDPRLDWGVFDVLLGGFYTAVYTALLTPYVLWPLDRWRSALIAAPSGRLGGRRRSRIGL